MTLILNPQNKGLAKVFRDYQEKALRYIWEMGDEGAISKQVWIHVNGRLEDSSISRASIINFLNAMVDEGVLNYHEETGKGGYHRVYKPKLDEASFKKHLAQIMISSLMRDYPEETKAAIKSL